MEEEELKRIVKEAVQEALFPSPTPQKNRGTKPFCWHCGRKSKQGHYGPPGQYEKLWLCAHHSREVWAEWGAKHAPEMMENWERMTLDEMSKIARDREALMEHTE